jgi:hypothetical protein
MILYRFRSNVLFIILLFVMAQNSQAETIDDLKGLSIKATLYRIMTFSRPPDTKYITEYQKLALQAYVSIIGNKFEYNTFNAYSGFSTSRSQITTLDKAAEARFGHLYTWTISQGHLSKVFSLFEGFRVFTISVNPAQMSCSFTAQELPDAATGKVVEYALGTGARLDVHNTVVQSSDCQVTKGNIFASDQ